MNLHAPAGCANCKGMSLLPMRREQWGGCALCFALAMVGTIAGWSFTLSSWLLHPDPRITLGLGGVSLCFTLVLLGHVIAYRRRVANQTA